MKVNKTIQDMFLDEAIEKADSTRHKARKEGEFHKLPDVDGFYVTTATGEKKAPNFEVRLDKSNLEDWGYVYTGPLGTVDHYKLGMVKLPQKDDVITGEKETMKGLKDAPKYYDNEKGSLYKVANERGWNPYLFDVVKRLERGGKKDPLRQEIEKTKLVLDLWLKEQENNLHNKK